MQQALDALKVMRPACFAETTLKAADTSIVALRERMEQPEQEPVAWYDKNGMLTHHPFKGVIPLYRAPYPWVGLTDEEVQEIMEKTVATCSELDDFTGDTARLTWKNCEAKLREKNSG